MPFNPNMDTNDVLAGNIRVIRHLLADLERLSQPLQEATDMICRCLVMGGKVLCCGNGGSACASAHFAVEIAGRYLLDRPGYPVIDLAAEHTLLTALVNDYPPEQLFARRVQAMGKSGDVLVVFSTTGRSKNVRMALDTALSQQMNTIGFLGRDGGECRGLAHVELIVPSDSTARIQELHLMLCHTICDVLDPILAENRGLS